jgi:uncharacterized membrane protein YfcA
VGPPVSTLLAFGPLLVAELLLLGCLAGFLAGLLGIGGGMLMVPFLTVILENRGVSPGMAVKMAIATSMSTIVFTSLSSVRAHQRRDAVRWDLVGGLAPGIVVGGLSSGAAVFQVLQGRSLALLFAGFVVFSAVQMLRGSRPDPRRTIPGWPGRFMAGALIGLLSGLLGAGGAFIAVPFMLWCNVPLRQAVGTSAALGFPVAVANTVGVVVGGWQLEPPLPGAIGYLHLPALAIIALASVLCAPWGAATAHRVDIDRLKRVFALLMFGLAAFMLHKALGAW